MKKFHLTDMLWLAAIVAMLCGAVMTYSTVTKLKSDAVFYQKKLGEVRELQAILKEYRSYMAARKACEELPRQHPEPLTRLLDASLLGPRTKVFQMKLDEDSAIGGWKVIRYQVDFGEVPTEMKNIVALIQDAEKKEQPPACPPWKLVDCHIWSSTQQAGYAGATLVFEALDKSD